MRLQQGQIWKKDDEYLRIVHWERLAIEYKHMKGAPNKKGSLHRVSKKEFCRMLKGAELLAETKAAETDELDAEEPETGLPPAV